MSDLRRTGINRSLHRPNLMAGGERIPVLLVGLITFALIAAIKTLASIIIGILLWFVSMYFLRRMAKFDPHASEIYRRQLKQQKIYQPKSRPFRTE
ncbi:MULTISPECIES: conjugal transfer protein TrbD [unclassified Acinetobacter]|uniref:conjugal transfer protein TrbD n=1 Tax=unclassified Acinetobacter TaxID=196816 RepID=UPI0015D24B7A|nr:MULTISPECIES: conjugal transfer protein TrbD [unclassified Acinetobacter]UUS62539.1 conjugal transfer protein TrbD [Acinetobacter sp. YH16056_T]